MFKLSFPMRDYLLYATGRGKRYGLVRQVLSRLSTHTWLAITHGQHRSIISSVAAAAVSTQGLVVLELLLVAGYRKALGLRCLLKPHGATASTVASCHMHDVYRDNNPAMLS